MKADNSNRPDPGLWWRKKVMQRYGWMLSLPESIILVVLGPFILWGSIYSTVWLAQTVGQWLLSR